MGDSGFPLGKKDGSQIDQILEFSLVTPNMEGPHRLESMDISFYINLPSFLCNIGVEKGEKGMESDYDTSWKWITGLCVIGLAGIALAAGITGNWVLTALPIGFLFGFFLEKGDLCGASAFSEVLLLKDWKKIQGIWVIIVVSMVGFSLLSSFGMVKLNPKPLFWASYIVGGVIFGVGMVLAGGCVSGSLFKTGRGNLNSMAALVGIPIGIMMVEHGLLNSFHKTLKTYTVKNADGGPVTFASVLHMPYWILAVIFAVGTIVAAVYLGKKSKPQTAKIIRPDTSSVKRVMTRRWRPWQAGVAIGLLACLAYLSSAASGRNYPLGVSHGVMHAELLLTDAPLTYVVSSKAAVTASTSSSVQLGTATASKKVSVWLILEILALVLGSFVSAKLSGRAKLLPKPPPQTIIAFFGGILVGLGAAIAGGCVVGNIMSGVALMSVGNLLFVGVVILSNWITTYFYLMGGTR